MFISFLRYTTIVTLCIQSVACTFFKPTPDSLNADIDHWLSLNQHDKIDYAINKIDLKKNPGFKKTLKRKHAIKKSKLKYIEKSSKAAQSYKSKLKWQQALDTYNNALNNIEGQPRLLNERKNLIEERDRQVNTLRKELLISRANALITYKNTYTTLQKLIPNDDSATFDINHYEDEKVHLASQLQKCGEHAIKNNQYTTARDCYVLSNNLMPSKKKLSFVDDIEKQLKSQANKKRFTELFEAYESAYRKKHYNKARTPLQTIIAIEPKHKKANKLLKSINSEINVYIDEMITSGKALYSEKKIKVALKTWKKAKVLAPENKELTQLIIRAEKVSKNLQKLKHGQQ